MSPPTSVLLLFAHPAFERSRVNRALIDAAMRVDGVLVHDLYEAYPDFDVDVRREQGLLEAHDTIVLQHPFYWYSAPALLKQWLDLVLQYGWAYGKGGTRLAGKGLMSAVTTGAPGDAYRHDGFHEATVHDFLLPFRQTARLCGLRWLPTFLTHGTHRLGADEIIAAANNYQERLEALVREAR